MRYEAYFLESDRKAAKAFNWYRVYAVNSEDQDLIIKTTTFEKAALGWARIVEPKEETKVGIHRFDGVFKNSIIRIK